MSTDASVTSSRSLRLGAFELRAILGKGGMGEVWSGLHTSTGTAVAVKLLKSEQVDEAALAGFLSECRAIASLDHPQVAKVYDFGRVPAEAERASGGRLQAGGAYLVMEQMDGSLVPWQRRLTWATLQNILLQALRGLGHTHAAGIIHRDLKPGNLLFRGVRPEQMAIKLADFGIALGSEVLTSSEAAEPTVRGTRGFLAPEQLKGDLRDYGPWTDLFALGITAQRLAWGKGGPDPRHPAPEDFGPWVARLTQVNPADRFAFAADAAKALMQRTWPSTPTAEGAPIPAGSRNSTEEPRPVLLPEIRPFKETPPTEILWGDAGVGIVPWRSPPLVGRTDICRALWETLVQTHASKTPQFVEIAGGAGLGKSRLLDWLHREAHERGVAFPITVGHTEHDSLLRGIKGLLAKVLRVEGLSRSTTSRRIARVLGPTDDARRVVDLLHPLTKTEPFATPAERYALAVRVLRLRNPDRPYVLLLDDVHYSSDTVGFLAYLAQLSDFPSLIVHTLRTELLPERSTEQVALGHLRRIAGDRLTVHELRPLGASDTRRLVQSVLGLRGALAQSLQERSAGNPQFAVQVVLEWVARGHLTASTDGYQLKDGAEPQLPASMLDVWRTHLSRVLHASPADDVKGIVAAAALGLEVAHDEWFEACAELGVSPSHTLASVLVMLRLIERHRASASFTFANTMIREVLLERIQGPEVHRAVARVLERRRAPVERIVRHWIDAGDWKEVLRSIHPAFEAAHLESDYARCERWHLLWDRTLRETAAEDSSDGRIQWWVAKMRLAYATGRLEESREAAATVRKLAQGRKFPGTLAREVAVACSWAFRATQEFDRGIAVIQAALERTGSDRPHEQYRLWYALGLVHRDAGSALGTTAAFEHAFQTAYEARLYNSALMALGILSQFISDAETTARLDALDGARLGPGARAHYQFLRGEIALRRGELTPAEQFYRLAIAEYQRAGAFHNIVWLQLNLAWILIRRHRWEEASAVLLEADRRATSQDSRAAANGVALMRLPIDAHLADWSAFALHFRPALEYANDYPSKDCPEVLLVAAEEALLRQEPHWARQAAEASIQSAERVAGPSDEARDLLKRLESSPAI